MAFRKSKTDRRNFSDIYAIEKEIKFGQSRYIKKKKECLLCHNLFNYNHNRQIYCKKCLSRKSLNKKH